MNGYQVNTYPYIKYNYSNEQKFPQLLFCRGFVKI